MTVDFCFESISHRRCFIRRFRHEPRGGSLIFVTGFKVLGGRAAPQPHGAAGRNLTCGSPSTERQLYQTELQQHKKREREIAYPKFRIGNTRSLCTFTQIPGHPRYPLLSHEAKQSGGASERFWTFMFCHTADALPFRQRIHKSRITALWGLATHGCFKFCSRSTISRTCGTARFYHHREEVCWLVAHPCIMCSHTGSDSKICTSGIKYRNPIQQAVT